MGKKAKVVVSKNGPYMVSGKLPLVKEIIEIGSDGEPAGWRKTENYSVEDNYALCRCGNSSQKPFCDGTHAKINFKGTETASREKYIEQAGKIEGPGIDLTDAQDFCSAGRFCHSGGGTWNLTRKSGDPKAKKLAIQEACNCPSGRLVAWEKETGKPIEPKFKPSISLIEDSQAGVSGPVWVKGGVSIESQDGIKYETRNRVTLCRCGKSKNKPFCDGSHMPDR